LKKTIRYNTAGIEVKPISSINSTSMGDNIELLKKKVLEEKFT
jgi:hypothetical protein